MDSTYTLIREAILRKQQVVAVYGGHRREMCPHVLGTKGGRPQALFYQFGGDSSSGPVLPGSPDNWRCLALEGLSQVSARAGPWHTGPGHSRPQHCVGEVDVEAQW